MGTANRNPLRAAQVAVIFDLDGTLTRPYLDFDAIRREIGIESGPILEALEDMDDDARSKAEAILLRHETEAAIHSTMQEGAHGVIDSLRSRGHPVGIFTRNARSSVEYVLNKHDIVVDSIRTREDGAIKPSPEPVLSICAQLNVAARAGWVVGDFLFDILSGKAAAAHTVLMIGDDPRPPFADQADFVIRRLAELLEIIGGAVSDPHP